MNAAQVLKTSQEQAVAAWIDWINQLRLNELMERLLAQDSNLTQALAELQKMKTDIASLLANNRGGVKGMHGFLAEAAEAGMENARNLIKGLEPVCEWINNNGPADLLRDGTEIQQKFVKTGGHFGLEAVKEHLEKYPDFIKNGGKYQLPNDFYKEIQRLLSLSQEEAAKESAGTYRLWKWVQTFFEENAIDPGDLEPSILDYAAAQAGKVDDTIKDEEQRIKKEDQRLREEAYKASKPTLQQGVKAASVAAAAEGGMAFCLGIVQKRKQGKRLCEFTQNDWEEIGISTAKGTAQGGVRGAAIYAMTNFTATPAAVANALVTAACGVVAQAYQLRQGTVTMEDFMIHSEVLCMDVSVSAIASLLGQVCIPVPVLGAVLGNVAGMFLYQIAKDYLQAEEQMLIQNYRESFLALDHMLEERYQQLVALLKKKMAKYQSMLDLAFDLDVNIAFDGSIALADAVGVRKDNVLRTKTDIDSYFLNEKEK